MAASARSTGGWGTRARGAIIIIGIYIYIIICSIMCTYIYLSKTGGRPAVCVYTAGTVSAGERVGEILNDASDLQTGCRTDAPRLYVVRLQQQQQQRTDEISARVPLTRVSL